VLQIKVKNTNQNRLNSCPWSRIWCKVLYDYFSENCARAETGNNWNLQEIVELLTAGRINGQLSWRKPYGLRYIRKRLKAPSDPSTTVRRATAVHKQIRNLIHRSHIHSVASTGPAPRSIRDSYSRVVLLPRIWLCTGPPTSAMIAVVLLPDFAKAAKCDYRECRLSVINQPGNTCFIHRLRVSRSSPAAGPPSGPGVSE